MNKKIIIFGFAALFALFAVSFVSAYNYDDGYFRDLSYSYTRSSGDYYGPVHTRAVNLDKSTDVRYLPYGGTEKVTTYTKRVLEDPGYGHYRPRYQNHYAGGYYNQRYSPVYTYYNNNPRVNRYQYFFRY
jgi:hypothetical protein